MSEWSKEHAWKACIRATVSGVQIPISPFIVKKREALDISGASRFFVSHLSLILVGSINFQQAVAYADVGLNIFGV